MTRKFGKELGSMDFRDERPGEFSPQVQRRGWPAHTMTRHVWMVSFVSHLSICGGAVLVVVLAVVFAAVDIAVVGIDVNVCCFVVVIVVVVVVVVVGLSISTFSRSRLLPLSSPRDCFNSETTNSECDPWLVLCCLVDGLFVCLFVCLFVFCCCFLHGFVVEWISYCTVVSFPPPFIFLHISSSPNKSSRTLRQWKQ